MNAAAYLQKQGWRGDGYSLDQTDRGLSKPLLISRREDLEGLGKKKSYESTSNQWWLNNFDKGLKSLGADLGKSTRIVDTAIPTTQGPSLYTNFIKAETLKSTIDFSQYQNGKMSKSKDKTDNGESKPKKDKSKKHKKATLEGEERDITAVVPPVNEDGHSLVNDIGSSDHLKTKKKEKKSKSAEPENGATVVSHNPIEEPNPKKSKKRKQSDEGDAGSESERRVSKKAKAASEDEKPRTHKEKSKSKRPADVRAERKRARQEKAREGALRNQARKAEEEAARQRQAEEDAAARAAAGLPEPDLNVQKDTEPPKPPHPESIAGLRAQGVFVDVPWVKMPPLDSRGWDYMTFLTEQQRRIQEVVTRNKGEEFNPDEQEISLPEDFKPKNKKKTYKADKYDREKAKRVAKRVAKHWQKVREHPEDYRPDGTSLSAKDRGITREELKAKRDAEREAKQRVKAEKDARHQVKEQIKVERRAAKKLQRVEKKRRNHELMQAHISAKIQKQKREKQELEAAARNMTWDEYMKEREENLAAKRLERENAKAESLGITLEELRERRERDIDEKEQAKEARSLGMDLEEYKNQLAEVNDEDIEVEDDPAARTGLYENFGRSGFDKVWASFKAKKEADNEGQTGAKSDTAMHKARGEEEESSDDNSSDSSSDPDSDSDQDDSGGVKLTERPAPPKATNATKTVQQSTPSATSASLGDDFIPLPTFDGPSLPSNESLGFALDTAGDRSLALDPTAPKKVKDMTKAERKARLQQIRAKRAEKAAKAGVTKLSKKERRRRRAESKEEIVQSMAEDLLAMRKQQKQLGGDVGPIAGSGGGAGAAEARAKAMKEIEASTDGKQKGGAGNKSERKQARREARRIMRGMKKGRIPEHEIPTGWEKKYEGVVRKKKGPSLRGNGGREPKRSSEKDVWWRT